MKPIVVKPGDHIAAIAFAHRVSVDDIWNHPENRPLRDKGRSPHLLHPGDVVYVPANPPRALKVKHGGSNAFTHNAPTLRTTVRVVQGKDPVANEPFVLHGTQPEPVPGTSDDQGNVTIDAPVHVRRAWIEFPARSLHLELSLGELDPVETPSGVRMRLQLLGLYHGPWRGDLDDTARAALRAFQRANDIDPSGEPTKQTRAALVKAVGT